MQFRMLVQDPPMQRHLQRRKRPPHYPRINPPLLNLDPVLVRQRSHPLGQDQPFDPLFSFRLHNETFPLDIFLEGNDGGPRSKHSALLVKIFLDN